MKELQEADEKKVQEEKAKADAAEAERKKAAETASNDDVSTNKNTVKPAGVDVKSDVKPIDPEMQRLLDIGPNIVEVINDMWTASALRKGWKLVVSSIEEKHGVELGTLSREVYTAYRKSNGSEEGLQELVKRHAPRQTTIKTPQDTMSAPIKTPEDSKSSTNQALVPNTGADIHPDTTADIVERNMKLTDEQVISSLRCEYGTSRV